VLNEYSSNLISSRASITAHCCIIVSLPLPRTIPCPVPFIVIYVGDIMVHSVWYLPYGVWYGTVRYRMVWYDVKVWVYGMVWYLLFTFLKYLSCMYFYLFFLFFLISAITMLKQLLFLLLLPSISHCFAFFHGLHHSCSSSQIILQQRRGSNASSAQRYFQNHMRTLLHIFFFLTTLILILFVFIYLSPNYSFMKNKT
jgi:hypothetical protein